MRKAIVRGGFGFVAVLALAIPGGVRASGAVAVRHTANPLWAGFVLENTTVPNMTAVSGTWTVPTASCAGGETSSSVVWVGLGGAFIAGLHLIHGAGQDEPLYQSGIDAGCANGEPVYAAWYELYTAEEQPPSQYLNRQAYRVEAGDVISDTVMTRQPENSVVWSITDVRNGTQAWVAQGTWVIGLRAFHTAECVVEDPLRLDGGGQFRFTDFGVTRFSDCSGFLGRAETSVTEPTLPKNWRLDEFSMVQDQKVLAVPSLQPLEVTYG